MYFGDGARPFDTAILANADFVRVNTGTSRMASANVSLAVCVKLTNEPDDEVPHIVIRMHDRRGRRVPSALFQTVSQS